jgi:hypothetical protein
MGKGSKNIWSRVGLDPEERLRWLLDFGSLDQASLNKAKRSAVVEQVRAFVVLQQVDPEIRDRLRFSPAPRDTTPNAMTEEEVWLAQGWLSEGLKLLKKGQKWRFVPHITYELDAYKGMFWARMSATSRIEIFKAVAYDALRDARFKFRRCLECQRPFVPVRRQRYCSSRCSQAIRTRKWRKAHPEKTREIRRLQYRRTVIAKFRSAQFRR